MRKAGAAKLMVGLGVLGMSLGVGRNAEAHRRDFPFTYDWRQPSKGEMEIESHSEYDGRDNEFKQAVEFEYGITNRLSIAPYVVFERESGGSLKYHEWKVETRYQLGKYKTGRILPGLYLEYAQERGEGGERGAKELEGKLILSRYDRKGGDLSFNLIGEHVLNADDDEEDWETKYSFGYARPLGHNKYETRGGFEWIHNLDSRQINAGPVLSFAPSANTWISMGAAFPINKHGEGNRTELRVLAEWEF
jgi:hypothetical protein